MIGCFFPSCIRIIRPTNCVSKGSLFTGVAKIRQLRQSKLIPSLKMDCVPNSISFSPASLINAANAASAIRGVFIPAGTSTVYDQSLGKNLKRPFLHTRYRASQTDNRKFKTWTTGSVGAATSALDAMQIHMLSERCLVTQGANNFMLMK